MSKTIKVTWDPVAANAALQALQSSTRMASELKFAEVHAEVLKAIERKVPRKDIVKALSKHGLAIAPAKLADLLDRGAKDRSGNTSAKPRARRSRAAKTPTQHSQILRANTGDAA